MTQTRSDDEDEKEDVMKKGAGQEPLPLEEEGQGNDHRRRDLGSPAPGQISGKRSIAAAKPVKKPRSNRNRVKQQDSDFPLIDGKEMVPGAKKGTEQPSDLHLPSFIRELQAVAEREKDLGTVFEDEITMIPNFNSPVFSPTLRLPPSYFTGGSTAGDGAETAPDAENPEGGKQPGDSGLTKMKSSAVSGPPSVISELQIPTSETEHQKLENEPEAASDDGNEMIPNFNSTVFSPNLPLPPSYLTGGSTAGDSADTGPKAEKPEEAEQQGSGGLTKMNSSAVSDPTHRRGNRASKARERARGSFRRWKRDDPKF
ncbi:unnamed protein product [Linum trigynum]|uniref:Uncharacterized protein n=1 Tax=Linum trigynum TaxID=586398 RepID=A0AAV2GEF1_9ROSI